MPDSGFDESRKTSVIDISMITPIKILSYTLFSSREKKFPLEGVK